jgi:hypothetical protein
MTKIFSKKSFNRVICLVLAAVFLSSFPAGATALALCLDMDKIHVADQKYLLTPDCHSSNDTHNLINNQPNATLISREANDCVDVSLSNRNALRRPSEITLPVFDKVILSYDLPNSQLGLQQQLAGYSSSALSQHLFTLPHINARRTVVLQI